MKYIEEGEEILKRCNSKKCNDCYGLVPSLVKHEDKIYITYEPCKMYYYRKIRERLKDFVIEIPIDKNFSNFVIDENLEGVINTVNLYLRKELYKKGYGIYFYGNTGSGKTHLSFAILNYINHNTDLFGFAVYIPEFIQKIRDHYSSGDIDINPVLEVAKIPVLLLDDLGAERYTEWTSEQIVQLLDFRYRNKLATIITSNLKLNDLKEKVGERIYSRVVGLSKPVLILNEDFRMKEQDW
ncbi:MAG: ATP-binding protein [Elusimicrobiota bacterium]|nr:ATP-binding protein [Endomicrobiia bacterium]MDW8165987.1 ATP-binding protein [Elusimicrobiota bacterium]